MAGSASNIDLLEQLEWAFNQGATQGRAVEAAMVQQACGGDHAAFSALYRRYVTAVYRYCWLRSGGDQEEVEDLTSQVFLRAWQAIGRYEERGKPFLAWLHTIARNVVVDHLRLQGKTVPLEDTLPVAGDMVDDIVRRFDYDHLRAALMQLTPDQRQVVIYIFILGYTNDETAAVMGKRTGAVRALQVRALHMLRKMLNRELYA